MDSASPANLPPQNLDAERSVLGAILLDNAVLDQVADQLREDDYYRESHRKIYAAMLDMAERSESIDYLTLENTLRERGHLVDVGGPEYLSSLTDSVPSLANVAAYARIVADKAVARRLIHASSEILRTGFQEGEDLEDVLNNAEQLIFNVVQRRTEGKVVPLKDLIRKSFETIESLFERREELYTGVTTGFRDLDQITSGFQPSDLVILAGRPSMGKTALALNIAQNAAARAKVATLFFSLEMSKESLAMRLLCSEARVDFHRLRKGMLGDAEWGRLARAAGMLAEAPLFIDDTPAIRVLDMRARARRLRADLNKTGQDLGMVCMDYLQLASPPATKSDSREREISEISRGLKGLAKELNVPILALSQLSRRVEQRESKRPQLADLRESGAIEQDADVILFIYRDDFYNQSSPDRGVAEVIVGKQRNGPTGTIRLKFFREHTRFEDLAEDREDL